MSEVQPEEGSGARRRPRTVNPAFRLLWLGGAASQVGDALFEVTLVVWIATGVGEGESWATLAVSGLLVASALPALLLGPIAGTLVDRWRDKRRVMLRCDLVSAAVILALLPLAGIVGLPGLGPPSPAVRVTAVLLVVAAASAVAQFFQPAALVLVRDVVPAADLERATGLLQTGSVAAGLVGGAAGPPLLVAFGPTVALLANAASFLVSFALLRRVRAPVPEPSGTAATTAVWRDLVDGLAYYRSSPLLRALTVSLAISVLGLGAFNALDVFFITENLGASVELIGLMDLAFGLAGLVGAAASGAVVARLGAERTVWVVLAAFGVLFAAYARMTSLPPALAVVVLFGLVVPPINVAVGPLIMRGVPREMLGRVTGVLDPLLMGASILGTLLGGLLYGTLLADLDATVAGVRFGPLDTIFLLAAALCLAGAAYARRNLSAPCPSPTPAGHPDP